ncbi:major capsid protein [Bacillus phage Riggi]|uniref:Major capsid protein n=1 Tax=Bacillus phage Riggi TaxID=2884426 RepID=U5PW76_9CAUD|nr:major head protein [Bacillus phage Riggi]AGY48179.1 major capsid protein [Bacillus phage Riggi]
MADFVLGQHPMLRKVFLDRRIKDFTDSQFVADQLFTGISVDALAIKFSQYDPETNDDGSMKLDDVPEVGEGSNYDRIGLSEAEKTALVKKYGLEFAVTEEMQKYGQTGQIERGLRRLATNIRGMVDEMAYKVATNGYTIGGGIQGLTKSGSFWNDTTDGAENMIADLVDAKMALKKYGYEANTVVINPEQEAQFLKNKNIRDAFRQNNTDLVLLRGYLGDFMGLSFIVDSHFEADNALILEKKVIGDIADADPLRTKTYNEDSNDRTIVRATRFTNAYLTDPKAVYLLKNLNN